MTALEISSEDNFLLYRLTTDIELHSGVEVEDFLGYWDGAEKIYLGTYEYFRPDLSTQNLSFGVEEIILTQRNYISVLTKILEP